MKAWAGVILLLLLQGAPARAGEISGRVLIAGTAVPDVPIADVQITLVPDPLASTSSTRAAFGPKTVFTDESGQFVIKDVPPGRYRLQWGRNGYVSLPPLAVSNAAIMLDVAPGQQIHNIVLSLVPGGVIAGHVLDGKRRPLLGTVTPLRVAYESGRRVFNPAGTSVSINDRGDFRLFGLQPGDYYVRAEYRILTNQYAETFRAYYPGVDNPSAAEPIKVRAGAATADMDFTVGPPPAGVTVSGALISVDPSLAPTGAIRTLFLLPSDAREIRDGATRLNNFSADRATGKFELNGVRPGRYDLYAVVGDAREEYSLGRATIDVGGGDLDNVSMPFRLRSEISGRLLLQDGAMPAIPGNPPKLKLSPVSPLPDFVLPTEAQLTVAAQTTGAFVFPRLPDLSYRVSVSGLSEGACIVDILQHEVSVYDEGFKIDGGPIDVVVSGKCGTVEANIRNAQRQTVSGAILALIPAGPRRNNLSLYRRAAFDAVTSRHLAISAVPPGEYKLFAWDSIPPGADSNTDFLREFEERGLPVTVLPAQKLVVSLSLIQTNN